MIEIIITVQKKKKKRRVLVKRGNRHGQTDKKGALIIWGRRANKYK
jgi:hypothetical protein